VVWINSEDPMAKALLGHVGGPDPRLVDEVRRLRRRVSDLETEIGRLLAERDLLTALERPLATESAHREELEHLDGLRTHAAALT
jgi:hypothetical protein